MGNFPREYRGAGMKLATIPWDGNFIAENPAVAVGRIASQPARDIYVSLCYVTGPATSTHSERAFSLAG